MFRKTFAETGGNIYYIVSKIISALPEIAKGLSNLLCPRPELIKTKDTINPCKVLENWF